MSLDDLGLGAPDEDGELKDLSRAIDLDKLRSAFFLYAGPDERMDQDEFKSFVKKLKLSESIAERLWSNLDVDKNGIVDADEFTEGLETMTRARAWLRFCPTCDFENSCEYCVSKEIANCFLCSPERFCPKHWDQHPGKPG